MEVWRRQQLHTVLASKHETFFPKLACKELSELAHQILYSLAKLWVLWVVFFSNVLESLDMLPGVSGQMELMPAKACKSAAA